MAFHFARVLAALLMALAASTAAAQTAIKFSLDGPVEGPEALLLLPRDKGSMKRSLRSIRSIGLPPAATSLDSLISMC
jgi:hypothetical protein